MIGKMTFKCVEESRDVMHVSQCDDDIYIVLEMASGARATVYLDSGQVIDLANHLNNYLGEY